jgi:serine/threonine-protein kinase
MSARWELEKTVQMPVLAGGASLESRHVPIALVEGSQPGLSRETDTLLRERLRIASLLLFSGFLAFLVKNLLFLEGVRGTPHWILFWDHLAITLLTGMIGWRLCTGCDYVGRHLRGTELLVFGGSATFFAFLSFATLVDGAGRGHLANITSPWILLIFTYALFIPNTWSRAARVVGTLAAVPIGVMLWACLTHPLLRALVVGRQGLTSLLTERSLLEMSLSLIFAAVTATWGVYTINSLRREAFEARQIGQYRLKRPLGSGGMGDVYLAEHVLMKRPCAIKLIKPEKAGDAQAMARFEREVQATSRLTHWNSIEIFDYGRTDDGTFYYVMEYLPGMNLDQMVSMHGPLPPERVIHLMAQVCDALSEAHSQQLVHRDIKPANIFAAHRGKVYDVAKLLDFGLARPLAQLTAGSGLTQEGTIAGSPLYMSPEQIVGEAADERSDIYSLGVVMYFLVTGRVPFDGDNPMKVLIAHANETPPRPVSLKPGVPADLEAIILRCLEKDPNRRFADALTLRTALLRCDDSGRWTRETARQWWECHGCPHKKELDQVVFEAGHHPVPAA